MLTHWCYILELEDNRFYIGETTNISRRLFEHCDSDTYASASTDMFDVLAIIGLYRIDNSINYHVIENDITMSHLDVENEIAENMMLLLRKYWWKARGGKYLKIINNVRNKNIYYENPKIHPDYIEYNGRVEHKRPACKCGLPCEIKQSKYGNFYWSCSMKANNSSQWLMRYTPNTMFINPGCDFYETIVNFN